MSVLRWGSRGTENPPGLGFSRWQPHIQLQIPREWEGQRLGRDRSHSKAVFPLNYPGEFPFPAVPQRETARSSFRMDGQERNEATRRQRCVRGAFIWNRREKKKGLPRGKRAGKDGKEGKWEKDGGGKERKERRPHNMQPPEAKPTALSAGEGNTKTAGTSCDRLAEHLSVPHGLRKHQRHLHLRRRRRNPLPTPASPGAVAGFNGGALMAALQWRRASTPGAARRRAPMASSPSAAAPPPEPGSGGGKRDRDRSSETEA